MDGSKRSSHGNAYFTGFGAAKRIVFFDTLLARLAPAEVEAVLAHELGHFKRHHVWKRIAWLFLASLVVPRAARLCHRSALVLRGAGRRAAAARRSRSCCSSWWCRSSRSCSRPSAACTRASHEFEADAYAASHASAADLVHALVKLYQDNAATLTPDPVHSAFYDSHPPAALRIARLQALARGERPRRAALGSGGGAYGRRLLVEAADAELVACVPRGKQAAYACGDRVFVARTGPRRGRDRSRPIARATLFLRAAPHRRKLIAANATQVAVIVAGEPSTSDELVCPHPRRSRAARRCAR